MSVENEKDFITNSEDEMSEAQADVSDSPENVTDEDVEASAITEDSDEEITDHDAPSQTEESSLPVEEDASPTWDPKLVEAFAKEDKTKYFFGFRKLPAFDNSSVLLQRMACNLGYTKTTDYYHVMDRHLTESYGRVAAIQLRHLWRIAHGEEAQALLEDRAKSKEKGKTQGYGLHDPEVSLEVTLSKSEWERDLARLSHYLSRKRPPDDAGRPAVMSEVWGMTEIEFESIFLGNTSKVIKLMQLALLADARENERLEKEWHRIIRHWYKVPLELSRGGIFSDKDAQILKFFGIYHLNDIHCFTVYQLKNMLLEHEFGHMVDELNAAFKEDLRKRRDRRYKVYPFVSGFAMLIGCGYLCYDNGYTLIKNSTVTLVMMALLLLWALTVPIIIGAGFRAIWRRKTRADYVYYTRPVKWTSVLYTLCTVAVIFAVTVCYHRYDGYDNNYYYRNLDDGSIAIAGLVNEQLVTADIPEVIDDKTVTEIDIMAFHQDMIETLTLPDTVKTIDKGAFAECQQLHTVTLNSGLTSIEKYAFYSTRSLEVMIFPETLGALGEHAFDSSSLITLDLTPTHITSLSEAVFAENAFESIVGLEQITEIGDEAFAKCHALKEVAFSDALISIGEAAFAQCPSIESITVPESVTYIGAEAFTGCSSLKTLTVPFIGTSADKDGKLSTIADFDVTDNMAVTVTVTNEATITAEAFKGCDWISDLILSDKVTGINAKAFRNLTTLKSVTIPSHITVIEEATFEGCASLSEVLGVENIDTVSKSAFANCDSLRSLELPALQTIGASAFKGSGLTSFGMSDAVTIIPESAFEGCSNLATVIWSNQLVTIEKNAFKACTSLKELTFPEKLVTVGMNAFRDCTGLETIHFSESMVDVHDSAFKGTDPEKVDIPTSLLAGYKDMFDINFDTVLTTPVTDAATNEPQDTTETSAAPDDTSEVTAPATTETDTAVTVPEDGTVA